MHFVIYFYKMQLSRVCAVLIIAVSVLLASSNAFSYDTSFSTPSRMKVGHLLVICDKEFSDRFQQDRQKIIDFWSAYMWDINLKFKTLPNVNLSFKISRLVIVKNTSDQQFVENAKNRDGVVNLLQAIYKFADWVYVHQSNFTDFDIAVLATGSNATKSSYTYPNAGCINNNGNKRHLSVIVRSFYYDWGKSCGLLDRSLGLLLGAPSDEETSRSICADENFIMRKDKRCGEQQYFFSGCSNQGIRNYVQSSSASCLHFHNSSNEDGDVIRALSVTPRIFSLDEQCKLLAHNSNAFAEMGDTPCLLSKCHVGQPGNTTSLQNLYPLDNSPCGEDKFCFRGRCLDISYQIQNVGTEKCLQESDRFTSNDQLIMLNCTLAPYPLDAFRILTTANQGIFLATPYSSPDASENDDKCLGLDLQQNTLKYIKCNTEKNKEFIGWDLVEAGYPQGEFLLYNRFTKQCAALPEDNSSSITLSENCDESNKLMRWKFHHPNPPQGVFIKPFSSKSTTISEGSTEKFYGSSSGVQAITKSSESGFEATTPLTVSIQGKLNESPSNSLSFILVVFLVGIMCGGILFCGVQRYGNFKICNKSDSIIHNDQDQSMPLYESGNNHW